MMLDPSWLNSRFHWEEAVAEGEVEGNATVRNEAAQYPTHTTTHTHTHTHGAHACRGLARVQHECMCQAHRECMLLCSVTTCAGSEPRGVGACMVGCAEIHASPARGGNS